MTESDETAVRELAREMSQTIDAYPECALECEVRRDAAGAVSYAVPRACGMAFVGTDMTNRVWHRDGRHLAGNEPRAGESLPGLISAQRMGRRRGFNEILVWIWNHTQWTGISVHPDIVHVPPLGLRIE